MFYIHHSVCISPQFTFSEVDLSRLNPPIDHKLKVMEPNYDGIPPGILRRMGKAVRIGVGAALPLLREMPDGIVIGTANGGMEDCIKFLNQIIDYQEGMLAPGNFVQSTTNAIAGQMGLMSKNKGYNITHVHRGLAFENAVLDINMLLQENRGHRYLFGGVDEISSYNYNIDYLDGWFKKESITHQDLYTLDSPGSIAGEGVAMFMASNQKSGSVACLEDLLIFELEDPEAFSFRLQQFLVHHQSDTRSIDLLLSGENGDNRFTKFYAHGENQMGEQTTVARFKHMSGEFPTASAFGFWLACQILQKQVLPDHMIKTKKHHGPVKRILIYNQYKGVQHSLMLLSLP